MNISITAAICVAIGFLISFLTAPVIIPFLRKLKFGQSILEIGPKWHKGKSGTPTMGGIIFIVPVLATLLYLRIVCSCVLAFIRSYRIFR